jgi:hypothetical protein
MGGRNTCDSWMPRRHANREEALAELASVFRLISDEYREKDQPLPLDSTEIVHA